MKTEQAAQGGPPPAVSLGTIATHEGSLEVYDGKRWLPYGDVLADLAHERELVAKLREYLKAVIANHDSIIRHRPIPEDAAMAWSIVTDEACALLARTETQG